MRKPLRLLGKNPHQWIRRKRLPPCPVVRMREAHPHSIRYPNIKSGVSLARGYYGRRSGRNLHKRMGYTQNPRSTDLGRRREAVVVVNEGAHTV